ncbi:MFS transporter [Falsochrobactrum shanghaiense]|uniref:MFS transporter n=1 Tax=Falsochrobactrum shanghaiense TaxID=2201899 RepID=A0A316JNP0_9HYPH|nr:MFS transporter [Falsochrobactrum shanghaiense]PWL16850.1 MFS transporter [Falsochrobactrum shanghaiense]
MRIYIQVLALLCGTAFLLIASGLHGLLLPLRGGIEGFSVASLGLLGTTWAGGFVAGCVFAPRLVRRVGHVRAFGCFAASAAIIALLSGIYIDATAWIVLRAFTGFSMAGAFMVIESWLNERATNESRGRIFGLYMMVNYGATMSGQMLVATGDIHTDHLFMITGIFFCLALIPTAISTAVSPRPLTEVQLDLKALYRNSPAAFVGCILIGIANGAWGTLGAVFGAQSGISTVEIALMVSVTIAAGALMQIPVGRISDLVDRRFVLAGVASLAALVGLLAFIIGPSDGTVIIMMTGCYGALAYALYPVAVAHANDHASSESFVKVSSGLLLLYGFGTMLGPLLGAAFMGIFWPSALFAITALAHISIAGYALFRYRQRAAPSKEEKDNFKSMPASRSATPEVMKLDPRAEPDN